MKVITYWRPVLGPIACLALGLLMSQHASAQVKADVSALVVKTVQTPRFNISGDQKPFKPKDWIEAEATMTFKASPSPKTGFLSETVEAEFFLQITGADNKPSVISFSGQYKNVPVDEPVSVVVYISPAGFARLTGKNKAAASDVKASGVKIKVSGKDIGFKNNGLTPASASAATPSSDILPKHKTPFRDLFYDRYLEPASE